MDRDENPTIGKIQGPKSIGLSISTTARNVDDEELSYSSSSLRSQKAEEDLFISRPTKPLKPQTKKILHSYETEETSKLTTQELQRLVLIEQLQTTRIQRKFYEQAIIRAPEQPNHQNGKSTNQTVLYTSFIRDTLTKWENECPEKEQVIFLMDLTSILSKTQTTFLVLHNFNVHNKLIGLIKNLHQGEDVELNLTFCRMLHSLMETKFGLEWVVGASSTWNHILEFYKKYPTERFTMEISTCVGKLFLKTAPQHKMFNIDLIQIAIPEFLSLTSKPLNNTSESVEEEWQKKLDPEISLNIKCFDYFSMNMDKDVFAHWVLYFDRVLNLSQRYYSLLASVKKEKLTLQISKVLLLIKIFEVKQVSESSKDICSTYRKSLIKLLEVNIQRGFINNVLELCFIGQIHWRTVGKLLELEPDQMPISFEFDLLIVQMMPAYITDSKILGNKIFNEKNADGAFRESYMDYCRDKVDTTVMVLLYKFRNILEFKCIIEETQKSIEYISKSSSKYGKESAITFFRLLVYCLEDFVTVVNTINKVSCENFNEKLIAVTLDALIICIKEYDVSWKNSVECIFILKTVVDFLNIKLFSETLIVKALTLLNLSILKYMSPNLVLLIDKNDSTMLCIGPLLYIKLRDNSTNIRNAAIKVLITISEISQTKFPYYQQIIYNSELHLVTYKIVCSDEDVNLRKNALKCLQQMVLIGDIWEHLLKEQNLKDNLIHLLKTEPVDKLRSEMVYLITVIFEEEYFSEEEISTIYNTMAHMGIFDNDTRLKVNVLNFWERVIKKLFHEEGMIDNDFPEVTFSKKLKKIVVLDQKEIRNRLRKIMDSLSSIGCLPVLVEGLNSSVDLEKQRSLKLSKELVNILNKYKFEFNVENTSISSAQNYGNVIIDNNGLPVDYEIDDTFLSMFSDSAKLNVYYQSVSPKQFLEAFTNPNSAHNKKEDKNEFNILMDSILNEDLSL
ncbi:unnamed protein product [Brassicogethes aeneus]|uniref:Uncharacterized protein n=1 Tax=Brassicogethes aeneus TaxID=1431903 RepID=A0A9P0FK42_BRAAE|nr:unnamed protein product [Brassicogethes aeneus]